MSRISVRTYGRTIAGATNRLSVRTDGLMHAWTTAVKSIYAMNRLSVHTYGETNILTDIDQVRISGRNDMGWGIERQLRQKAANLI